jgi:hypothetical protein
MDLISLTPQPMYVHAFLVCVFVNVSVIIGKLGNVKDLVEKLQTILRPGTVFVIYVSFT